MDKNNQPDDVLMKAISVFFQYGYRKTSLDDVANAVDVSRQTLYQRYKNKENLFKLAVEAIFTDSISQCREVVNEADLSTEESIEKIFDIWCGECVSVMKNSPHAAEVMDATHSLIGGYVKDIQQDFIKIIIEILERDENLSIAEGMNVEQVAETLYYTSKGIMQLCEDYEEFTIKLKDAISIICRT